MVIDNGPCESDNALPGNRVQAGQGALIGRKRDKLLLFTIQMKREQGGLYRGVRHMSRLEVGLGEWTSMWISLIRHVCTYITGHTTVLSITGGF
jgi:hypothetical protein